MLLFFNYIKRTFIILMIFEQITTVSIVYRMPKNYLFIFFVLLYTTTQAQYENLVNKPYKERAKALNNFLELSKKTKSYEEVLAFSRKITRLGILHKDKALELEGDFYAAFYYLASEKYNEEIAVAQMEAVIKKAQKANIISLQIRATNTLGYYFWNAHQQYERGFRYYIKTHELLQKTNYIDFPEWINYYSTIANSYYAFSDYKTAIFYAKKITNIPVNRNNWKSIWLANNNLGVYYKELNVLDSAKYYYKKALSLPYIKPDDLQYTISKGNIGDIYFDKEDYDTALPILEKDFENAKKHKDYGLAISAALRIAKIFIHKKKYTQAVNLLKFTSKHLNRSKDYEKLIDYYDTQSNYFFSTKNITYLKLYNDSLVKALNTKYKKLNTTLLLRAKETEALNKIEAEKIKLEFIEKTYKNRIIAISIISLVSLLAILIIFLLRRKKHKIERELQQQELTNAKDTIKRFKEHLANRKHLEKLNTSNVNTEVIQKIVNERTLKSYDWEGFSKAFNILYEGYLDRLKVKIPSISKTELKVVMLYKLNLTNQDICLMLNVSPQAVRTSWYRLSKKVPLGENTDFKDFVVKI